ncbi:ERIC3 protein, partial [Certhia brachydactyla]|nr:ERIC3 protein [Certhia brachydactyla]
RLLETYNSLTDKHLVGYFSNARIRRHLQKAGLISRSGRIIPEKEYRLNALRRDHQRSAQECLADAIFHKVLDMEHHHQIKKTKSLECSGSKEKTPPPQTDIMRQTSLVLDSVSQRCKCLFFQVEEVIGSVEEVIEVHCPHPPLTPRSCPVLCPLVATERVGRSRWRAPCLGVDCGGGCCACCPYQPRTRKPALSKVVSSPQLNSAVK